ncbi:hypothetical protein D3C85_1663620 [compost metagenome]
MLINPLANALADVPGQLRNGLAVQIGILGYISAFPATKAVNCLHTWTSRPAVGDHRASTDCGVAASPSALGEADGYFHVSYVSSSFE